LSKSRSYKIWTDDEETMLRDLLRRGIKTQAIAKELNRPINSVDSKIKHLIRDERYSPVPESTMPKYLQPLKTEGDAVILSDFEAPFHHAEFINKVLDIAYSSKVETLHLAGDILHNDKLSMWGAEWTPEATGEAFARLEAFVMQLPNKFRSSGLEMIDGMTKEQPDELQEARRVFRNLDQFKQVVYAIGNHDDRYLRALNCATSPRELLVQIDRHNDERWKIAAYYYSLVETEKGLYRIEHPRGAGRSAAQDLAVQYHCHVIMGHSHRWSVNLDPSGDYWAIQTGHCVDEERLAYVMQRSAKRDAHRLGATIIRGGYPFVLHPDSPFEIMKRW